MTQTATATASLSKGAAVEVSRQGLSLIETPERTSSFYPVAHAELVDLIENRLASHGMVIQKERYAVQSNGMKLYGVMILKHQTREDFSFSIGIKTSNDKSLAAQLIAGTNIFVCENGMFSGMPITWRKHTGDLDIASEITDGVNRAVQCFATLDTRISILKETAISVTEAKAFVVDAAMKGVISERLIVDVVKTFIEPPHAEFADPNMWSLHNSFTEVFKTLRPNVAMDNAIELGKMFEL